VAEYWVFQQNMRRAKALIATHSRLHNKRGKPRTVVSDIMRAAVVLAVSAIDAYLHGVAHRYVAQAASLNPVPPGLLEMIKEWQLRPTEILSLTLSAQGADEFSRRVEGHFADRTLQDPSKVEQVFRILGIGDVWSQIAQGLGRPIGDVRRQFAAIVKRRHQIAHEADLDPEGKGPTKKRALGRDTAAGYCTGVEQIVSQMNQILSAKYPE
jgi:RiboL-PSP-HEPN